MNYEYKWLERGHTHNILLLLFNVYWLPSPTARLFSPFLSLRVRKRGTARESKKKQEKAWTSELLLFLWFNFRRPISMGTPLIKFMRNHKCFTTDKIYDCCVSFVAILYVIEDYSLNFFWFVVIARWICLLLIFLYL